MEKKVLIIEDSKTDANILVDLLREEGLIAEVASTGKRGLELAQEMVPDLVLLDLMLPDMSGLDICSEIKSDNRLKNTMVVVVSSQDDIKVITEAFHRHADDYILKPPVPEFLIKKIKLYIGNRN